MRVGPARKKVIAYVWALCIGLVVIFSAYSLTTAYAASVVTAFEGELENNQTFVRPKMPGDVAFENDNAPDYLNANLFFSLTWFYQGDTIPPTWTSDSWTRTDGSNQGDPSYTRNYFVRKLTPSASGNYDITVVEGGTTLDDTTLFLYKGSFDATHPLDHLYAGNDDTDAENYKFLSSMVNVPLEAGTNYYIVMTSYDFGATGHVKFEAVGPGSVNVIDPANAPTEITTHPTDTVANVGGSTTFQVTATGKLPLTYQWQVNTGSGYVNINDGGPYSGVTTSTLSITGATEDMHEYRYRVIVTGLDSKTSNYATLRVNHPPVFVSSNTEMTVSQNAAATDVKSLLHVSDTDLGQTLTWTEKAAPDHGKLIINSTSSSGSSDIAPGGIITYEPDPDYSGPDSFQIEVSDGYAAVTRTINVTVVANPAVISVAVPPGDTYVAGEPLEFTVKFDQPVTVVGTPQLSLTIGTKTVSANYVSGTDSTDLLFRYTVAEGDFDADGISINALILNGGSIQSGSKDANLALNGLGNTSGVKVDAVAPTVTGVTSSQANGAYKAGALIPIEVTFSEPMIVTGTPQLMLETGTTDRTADFKAGVGATLTFEYIVQAGDLSTNLDYASANALVLNGGTIHDLAGNAAVLTLSNPGTAGSLGANKAIVIDTTVPKIESVDIPTAGSYKAGTTLTFTVNTDEPIVVNTTGGNPRIGLAIGSTEKYAEFEPTGSTATKLNFVYTVVSGDEDADGVELASSVELNGGTIQDAAGNDLELTFDGVDTNGILVDTVAPNVTGVSVPPNATYVTGQTLEFIVAMNEPVIVTGEPTLGLIIGGVSRSAQYKDSVSDSELKFGYTVTSGDFDNDGINLTALSLPGGAGITDTAGNAAVLTLNNVADTSGVLVDAVQPQVTGVSVPAAGTYTLGESLTFTVHFNEVVVVQTDSGTPVLPLTIGTASVKAAYKSGTGTNEITFEYIVKSGDSDTDGIQVGSEIELSGGAMSDLAGNDILPELHNVDDTTGVLVDAGAQSVEAVVDLSAPAAGASNTVTLTVKDELGHPVTTFSGEHDVTVSGYEEAPNHSYGSIDGTPLTGGSLTVTVEFTNGQATVDLQLNKADEQSITFGVAGVTSTGTVTIAPVAGPAASMKLSTDITSPASNGGTFAQQPVITLVDAFGNVSGHDDSTVITAVKEDSGTWSLTGTTSRTAQAGVVTFTDLGAANSAAVAGARIAFEAAGLPTVLSSAVSLPWPSLVAPVIETVTPGDGHVRIEWSPVYGAVNYSVYMRTASTDYGTEIANVTDTVYEATGLTNGTTYSFVVKAVNLDSISPASNEVSATPQVPTPGAPILQPPVAGDARVTLTWSPVAGSTGYKLFMRTASSDYGAELMTVTGSVYSQEVTGLTNGMTYSFVVKATNNGVDSAASNEVSTTPRTVPSAPTDVTVTAGDRQATVRFEAPVSDGGSPITKYIVTASPGNITAEGAGSPIAVTGLTNGMTYTFTVQAVNAIGPGAASAASNPVTPSAPASEEPTLPPPTGNPNPPAGSPTPASPANEQTGVEVLVNGKVERAGTSKTTVEAGRTYVTVTVDPAKLEQKLAEVGERAVITIPVQLQAEVVAGELSGQSVKSMERNQAIVEIKTEKATYTLPAEQIGIDSVAQLFGGNVKLEEIKVRIEIAEPADDPSAVLQSLGTNDAFAIVVPPLEFMVKATYGDKTVEVSRFSAYVERTIAIPEGVNPDKITTGVVVKADGTVRHVPTRIVTIDGKYYAKINSLTNSIYTVVWHPLAFQDVIGHWAEEAVNDMGSRMVIDGVGGESFAPDQPITRAEFAAIMVRGLGLALEDGTAPFADIKSGDWYAEAVRTAYEYGLLEGYEDGTFRPMERITREQAMVIIAKAMTLTGLTANVPPADAEKTLASFADAADVSEWARSGVAAGLKAGIVSGRDHDRIAPGDSISRAEVAALVRRLLQKSGLI